MHDIVRDAQRCTKYRTISYEMHKDARNIVRYRTIPCDIAKLDALRCKSEYRTVSYDIVEIDCSVAQISYDIVTKMHKDAHLRIVRNRTKKKKLTTMLLKYCTLSYDIVAKMHKDAQRCTRIGCHPMTSDAIRNIVRYCLQLTAIWARR